MKSLTLNNGLAVPILGLGTWQGPPGRENEVYDAVKTAIDLGYRHFDCAFIYKNEHIIGEAIQEKIKEGKVKREELFIVSKLWNTFHRPEHVEVAIKTTLKNIKLDYLDLYLMHWPHAYKYAGDNYRPEDPKTGLVAIDEDTDYLDTYKAMEELVSKGYTRSIGVSNFNSKQISRLVDNCRIVPVINQVECHPYLNQEKLRKFCNERGILLTAYSPLGSRDRPWAKPGEPDVLGDEKLAEIAKKYGKTPGQILIRFQIQLGNAAIPKSSNPVRLKENIDVFDFELSQEDLAYLNTFNRKDGRICLSADYPKNAHHPHYPPGVEF